MATCLICGRPASECVCRDSLVTAQIHGLVAERGTTHGDYAIMSLRIQDIKAVMRRGSNWDKLSAPQKEALELIATKLGRIIEGDPNFRDHWDDLGGYAVKGAEQCR